jgi:DNA-binding LacI/PurR family transcriptional regulator
MRDVAALAGVSTATVSRYLKDPESIRPEARERTRRAVEALDYHPSHVARSLRVRATRTVGLVIPDIQNPFFTSVVRGIEDVLRGSAYHLVLGNSDDDPKREAVYLQTLRGEGAAGIILVPTSARIATYSALLRRGTPVVTIDRSVRGLDTDRVVVANGPGARDAVAHLVTLGHRRVGFIGGPEHVDVARLRRRGYEQALKRAQLRVEPALVRVADFREAAGHDAMSALLELPSPPSAVFVANNLMTLGALRAIHERSLRIPADVALVSFDDMPWAASLQPPLTAVAQPTYELGATAARLLLDRMREPDLPRRRVVLPAELIVRASCGSLRRGTHARA